jgi:replicative DNA helicase
MNKNFDYLGNTFQIQLLNQIIVDKDFSQSIMDVIESSYFDNKYFKIILQLIKEYYKKYRSTPNFDTLDQIIKSEISQELVLKIVLDTIVQVKNAPNEGASFVQEKALKFCKQQELQKAMDKAQKIISEGDFESYDKVEGLVRNALQVGEIDKGTTDIFQGLDTVLDEDYRHPIPMGIPGIDKLLKGGLSKGEIGVILAPTGVGKSTILTKIANTAFNMGYNVLQIFFEDNPKIIQRKHFTIWTGIAPDDLANHKEEVLGKINEIKETMTNKLILKKLASDSVSISYIKNQVRKIIADGNKVDMILLDYIDCVLPDIAQDEWKAEGSVMRGFEAMCHELDLVGWTATQGNRCVSLDTIVDIENKGKIEIKDVTVGDKILTHDGYKNVYHVFPVEKQPVYRIKTKSGKEIKVSSKHKFPTSEKTLKSIESGLKVGDNLFIKNIFEIDEIESIELIGEEDTVDISVEDTHMFFANDIYTHNSSISAEVVTTDQMGGSIKKAQVGHVIITVAKTLQQKEMNLATIAITKSRLGKDGVVFENCKFNNEMMEIDTDSSVTFLGFEEQQEERKRDRVKELMEKRKQKQEQQNLI